MAVRRDRAMASSATCGACARAATFTAKVNDSSAAASSRSSLYSSTVAPDRPAAEPRLEVRSASPTWCAEREPRGLARAACRSPCRVCQPLKRCGTPRGYGRCREHLLANDGKAKPAVGGKEQKLGQLGEEPQRRAKYGVNSCAQTQEMIQHTKHDRSGTGEECI